MKIEIAEPGRMTQSGSSLLRLIQNNSMSELDLLVRESVQNSLDARKSKEAYVTVNFITGKFKSEQLNNHLDGVKQELNQRYSETESDFIAIRDYNTVGLTGELNYENLKDNNYGNLLKLVYEICKPQENEGAGGSWGLGKTVYFRVGIGLVFYYSRVLLENGDYQERLVASLVEDERKENAIIPAYKNKLKRGIAWWGEEISENKTQPITDSEKIREVISIFNITPYNGEQTGTSIIIPYINKRKLLEMAQYDDTNCSNDKIVQYWSNSIEESLKVSLQRWYAPRISNLNYPYGAYLRVTINGVGLGNESMEPFFQIVQGLYNRAISPDNKVFSDILSENNKVVQVEKISLRNVLVDGCAGILTFVKVNKSLLKMCYPNNKPSPYIFCNSEAIDSERNKPIVMFTRKPGMIISYENSGNWVDGIIPTNKDEYIIGFFVLNSKNNLISKYGASSLEEYVRSSEKADHTSWNDPSDFIGSPRIISKIKKQVSHKISKEFGIEEQDKTKKLNSGLAKYFGDLVLPPQNFGKRPSDSIGSNNKGKKLEKHRNFTLSVDYSNIKYFENELEIEIELKSNNLIQETNIILGVESESGIISGREWEEKIGIRLPVSIEYAEVNLLKVDNSSTQGKILLNQSSDVGQVNGIEYKLCKNNEGQFYLLMINMADKHKIELKIRFRMMVYRKDAKPVFLLDNAK